MNHRSYSRILFLGLAVLIAVTGLSVVTTGSIAAQQVDVDPSDLSGEGTIDDPYVITNASELQAIENNTFANYRLGNDINVGNTSQWNNGKGFNPIGDDVFRSPSIPSFTATLDGKNHTLTGLTIIRPSEKM